MNISRPTIEVKGLTKNYRAVQAIENLSFEVARGEIVGLLGPNGAGKSTTMRILCGLMPATSGEAYICGISVARYPSEVKRQIGYMPEHNPLPEDLRVIEYLRLRARLKGLPSKKIKKRVNTVMDLCDLNRKARYRIIGKLSKGYRQRVGVADAILSEPKVIIMDEPTIGLDPHQILNIRNLINSLRSEMTVILSSHILPEIEQCCDRIIIINHGHIVANGTPQELRKDFIPTTTYTLNIKGEIEQLNTLFTQLDSSLKVVDKGTPDNEGFCEVSLESSQDKDFGETLIESIARDPKLTLKALSQTKPDLEHIFMAATKRSWDQTIDGKNRPKK